MNSSEERRKELLSQTRSMYTDRRTPPAVHPRYNSVYAELYKEDEDPVPGTFGLRVILCLLLFALFVTMDYQDMKVADVSSSQIVSAVETPLDVERVWKNLP